MALAGSAEPGLVVAEGLAVKPAVAEVPGRLPELVAVAEQRR